MLTFVEKDCKRDEEVEECLQCELYQSFLVVLELWDLDNAQEISAGGVAV
jgi:hypothetical protein